MASWRKLMTPMYDKYMTKETDTSCLSQSKFGEQTDRSMIRDSIASSISNDKLHKLQLEMNRLKSDLGKFSNSQRSFRNLTSRTKSPQPLANDSIEEDNSSQSSETSEGNCPITNNNNTMEDPSLLIQDKFTVPDDKYDEQDTIEHVEQATINDTTLFGLNQHNDDNSRNEELKGRNLLQEDYGYYTDNFNPLSNDISQNVQPDDNDISMLDRIHEKQTIGDEKSMIAHEQQCEEEEEEEEEPGFKDLNPSMTQYQNTQNLKNQILPRFSEEQKTEKPSKRYVEKKSLIVEESVRNSRDQSSAKYWMDANQSKELKRALFEYRTEIDELKNIVLASKSKIDFLQEELHFERRKSQNFKGFPKHPHSTSRKQSSIKRTPLQNNDRNSFQQVESPIIRTRNQRSPISSVKQSYRRNRSYDAHENGKPQNTIFHSSGKSRDNSTILESRTVIPSEIFNSFKKQNKSKYLPRSNYESGRKNSCPQTQPDAPLPQKIENSQSESQLSKAMKTQSTQCDLMLENITQLNERDEDLIEEQRNEIDRLRSQVQTLKDEKNSMINTFQEIIEMLSGAQDTTKASIASQIDNQSQSTSSKSSEIQSEFSSFYQSFSEKFSTLKTEKKFPNISSNQQSGIFEAKPKPNAFKKADKENQNLLANTDLAATKSYAFSNALNSVNLSQNPFNNITIHNNASQQLANNNNNNPNMSQNNNNNNNNNPNDTLFQSRNLNKTNISDNLYYSPSNIGASFLDTMIESKPFGGIGNSTNNNPNTLKLESPFLLGSNTQGFQNTLKSFAISPTNDFK